MKAILELDELRAEAEPGRRSAAAAAQLSPHQEGEAAALDAGGVLLHELLGDEVIRRRARRHDVRRREWVANAADNAEAPLILLRERLRRRRGCELADRGELLPLLTGVEVAEMHAFVVVDPATFVAVAPRHHRPHPTRVEFELKRIRPEDVEAADHALSVGGAGGAGCLDAGVVERDDGLGGDRLGWNQVPAGCRLSDPDDVRHGDPHVDPVIAEEDPFARLGVDLVALQVGRGEELKVVEALVRQERDPRVA